MKRRIIQVTAIPTGVEQVDGEEYTRHTTVVALCNDGTVWDNSAVPGQDDVWSGWCRLPDIPQAPKARHGRNRG